MKQGSQTITIGLCRAITARPIRLCVYTQ